MATEDMSDAAGEVGFVFVKSSASNNPRFLLRLLGARLQCERGASQVVV